LNYNPREIKCRVYIHTLLIAWKQFLFRLESPSCNCNRGASEILLSIWVGTLVRAIWITSNPFVISKSSANKFFNEKKKKSFFSFLFSLHLILRNPDRKLGC